MTPVRRERVALVILAIVVSTVLSLVALLASGFFVAPVIVGVCALALFYWALRHQGVRNPLSPQDMGLSGRWADGQPLHRTMANERRQKAIEEEEARLAGEAEEKRHHDDAEREEALRRVSPGDFEGPPPINPFP